MSSTGNIVTTASETYNFGGLSIGGTTGKYTTNDLQTLDISLDASLTDHVVDFVADVADSVAHGIEADQDCTVKTYASTTLKQTFDLKAKKPRFWNTDKEADLVVFTDNFDSIKVTTTVATRLKIGNALNVTG